MLAQLFARTTKRQTTHLDLHPVVEDNLARMGHERKGEGIAMKTKKKNKTKGKGKITEKTIFERGMLDGLEMHIRPFELARV